VTLFPPHLEPRPGEVVPTRRAVSVIVCAYTEKRWEDLCKGMAALATQTLPPAEVLLVVDHSEDLLRRARPALPWVRVVPNDGPRGLSAARNTGVSAAQGEILVFLDDDALPAADWLERLVEPYVDPDVVAVGGSAVPAWPGPRPGWFPAEFDWVVGCSYRGLPTGRSEIRNLMGCNMSFRADVLAEDPGFPVGVGRVGTRPAGCEETELCIRIRQRHRSARIIYEPGASVRHRVTPERTRWQYFVSRCYAEGGSKALVAKHVGADDALRLERTYCLRTLPSGVLGGVRAAIRGDRAGLGQAGAIVAGFGVTAAGYGGAALQRAWAGRRGRQDGVSEGPATSARPGPEQVDHTSPTTSTGRDPAESLDGCRRVLVLGRTGSGKTTLARQLAGALDVPHVELDALYFGPDFSTAPLPVLRDRTRAAIAGDRWVTDGNKSAVRDLVWPRADTVVWLDYPLAVSLWRLGKRAVWRTSVLTAQATDKADRSGLSRQLLSAASGVITALRSHRGQRHDYPRMFARPANSHLAVVRLRSPRATRRWLSRVRDARSDHGTDVPSAQGVCARPAPAQSL
jgi:hypothetical protein